MPSPLRIQIVDSHTAGEPTRVVVGGFPDLGGDTLHDRREAFRQNWDHLRRGLILEPRGSDVLVGALLTPPVSESAVAGVIFFNNAGMLGMCGHGTIGVVETLRMLGRVGPGSVNLDTPVGTIQAVLEEDGEVVLTNVPSYRTQKGVTLEVPGYGEIVGDVAYGGNWFFLVKTSVGMISPERIDELSALTWAIRQALEGAGIAGEAGAEIDHIELFSDSPEPGVDSRNFVLCPGKAFDRSPCGTGTSAKIACLLADGVIQPGQTWVQESVTGGIFRASGEWQDGRVVPKISGRAYVTGTAELVFAEADPYRWGLPTS